VITFKVSSIIFLPCGTVKACYWNSFRPESINSHATQGPPPHAAHVDDEVDVNDYINTIAVTRAPDEAYIQLLEQQQLAIRNVSEGYELDSTWDSEDIYAFLRPRFPFLFRYFEEGPNAKEYESTTPFIVVNKSRQTLSAVPYKMDGDVLRRNSDVPRSGLQMRKLFFGEPVTVQV
jgi:hypothetical protein